ncbi:MAG: triose-phosphate isomerase [Bacteroidales bacterium]|nr:triose-phosphate isomerase [Bacteroidales bacterium]MCB9000023.1 triose-phosphate isomerase [Bacteroidales bacterium]MCB9013247.1 triose-phosphate isomerase [Bacteroidales bacterium]
MRKNIVAGNWKMNTLLKEGMELATAVNSLAKNKTSNATVIIAPPFTHLAEIKKTLTDVKLAAQNCASEESGAFTGEVSVGMLKSLGAEYIIIGHSERRAYYHEDNAILAKKVNLCLAAGLKPIFCIGEVLPERNANKHFDVVKSQLSEGVFHLSPDAFENLVIAYEPVWAIGTGVTASPEQAQEMHKFIRSVIAEKYGSQLADSTTILYGGSCKGSNAKELFANPDVDGGLIGGASLKAEEFLQIVNAF